LFSHIVGGNSAKSTCYTTYKALQVSFAKETCKRDDILQKSPIISRSLLIVARGNSAKSTCYTTYKASTDYGAYFREILYKIKKKLYKIFVQGDEIALDAFSCRCLLAKEPLITGLFCGK